MSTIFNLLLHIVAICIFCTAGVIAFKNKTRRGAREFIVMIIAVIIWTFCSTFEIQTVSMDSKIGWHNLSMIGYNFVPVTVYLFTISFTDAESRVLKRMRIPMFTIYFIITALMLLYPKIQIVKGFEMRTLPPLNSDQGPAQGHAGLLPQYTAFGKCYIVYNLILIGVSVCILINFYARAGKLFKRQILCVTIGISLIAISAWSDMIEQLNYFGILTIPIMFVLSSVFILIGMFGNQLFHITAFARDKIIDVIEEGVAVSSYNGKIVDVNTAAASILCGTYKSNIQRNNTKEIVKTCNEIIKDNYAEWLKLITYMRSGELEIKALGAIDKYYTVSIYPIDSEGEMVGTISILKDITIIKKKIVALKTKAEVDGLTKILNRAAFFQYVENSIKQSDDSSECLWMIFFDIDYFKRINDTYGHAAGDYVLSELAGSVKKSIRKGDIFGRLGGEEFGVFKTADSSSHCYEFCERIKNAVENNEFLYEKNKISVTISIGCSCTAIADFLSVEKLLDDSDKLLYKAKHEGRNRIEMVDCCKPDCTK